MQTLRSIWFTPAALAILLLPACAIVPPESGPSTIEVIADWDDIDAAVDVALKAGECAILQETTPATPASPTRDEPLAIRDPFVRRVFQIRSISDARGELVLTRAIHPIPNDKGSIPITIEARLGDPHGLRDTLREGRLVAATRRRLTQLAGVDWHPGDN